MGEEEKQLRASPRADGGRTSNFLGSQRVLGGSSLGGGRRVKAQASHVQAVRSLLLLRDWESGAGDQRVRRPRDLEAITGFQAAPEKMFGSSRLAQIGL